MHTSQAQARGQGSSRRRNQNLLSLILSAAAALLAACAAIGERASGPEYTRPAAETPTEWSAAPDVDVSAEEAIQPNWWTQFGDPYLDSLVQKAVVGNYGLRMAMARIEQAAAALSGAEAQRLPSSSFGASSVGASYQQSEFSLFPAPTSFQSPINWEIDIWGKLRKGVAASTANYNASEAEWRAAYLATVAGVANTYFTIHRLDEQIDFQARALNTSRKILSIYRAQHREGIVPKTQVLSQEAEVNDLRRALLDLKRERELAENALATLIGVPAEELSVPVAPLRGKVEFVDVPVGLPSDLLSRRPDIVAAEYNVLAAHELLGQARLARLPSVSLTGGASGLPSLALTALVKSLTFNIGPSINIPIFNPGLQAEIETKDAQARAVKVSYQQTVIESFQEVEDALVNLASYKKQKEELEAQLHNLKIVAQQTRAQLEMGLASQLEVFESERSRLEVGQALLENHQLILTETVNLYKALGGGWTPQTVGAETTAVVEP